MAQKVVKIRLHESQLAMVDAIRGDVPRERWIRRLVTDAIAQFDRATMAPASERGAELMGKEPRRVVKPPMSKQEADGLVERVQREAAEEQRTRENG